MGQRRALSPPSLDCLPDEPHKRCRCDPADSISLEEQKSHEIQTIPISVDSESDKEQEVDDAEEGTASLISDSSDRESDVQLQPQETLTHSEQAVTTAKDSSVSPESCASHADPLHCTVDRGHPENDRVVLPENSSSSTQADQVDDNVDTSSTETCLIVTSTEKSTTDDDVSHWSETDPQHLETPRNILSIQGSKC